MMQLHALGGFLSFDLTKVVLLLNKLFATYLFSDCTSMDTSIHPLEAVSKHFAHVHEV